MAASDAKVLQKVHDLVKLAASGDTEEARNAAVSATKLMKEHELVLVPKAEIQRVEKMVEGAQALAKQYKDEKMQNMLVGGVVGLLLSKQLKF